MWYRVSFYIFDCGEWVFATDFDLYSDTVLELDEKADSICIHFGYDDYIVTEF